MAEKDQIDAERVAQMRAMLSRPGGDQEVRRRFGDAAVNGPEAEAARRQLAASRDRQRQVREDAARDAEREQQARERATEQARAVEARLREQSPEQQSEGQQQGQQHHQRTYGAAPERPATGRLRQDPAVVQQRLHKGHERVRVAAAAQSAAKERSQEQGRSM